jgi:hypothetical protein
MMQVGVGRGKSSDDGTRKARKSGRPEISDGGRVRKDADGYSERVFFS